MSKTNGLFFSWVLGSFFSSFMFMAIQGFYGLEGYIEHLQKTWIDLSPAWGMAGLIITVVLYMYVIAKSSNQ